MLLSLSVILKTSFHNHAFKVVFGNCDMIGQVAGSLQINMRVAECGSTAKLIDYGELCKYGSLVDRRTRERRLLRLSNLNCNFDKKKGKKNYEFQTAK